MRGQFTNLNTPDILSMIAFHTNNMKTNAQRGENQPARYRDVRHSNRRLCVSWLASLLLATSGMAAIVGVDVGGDAPVFNPSTVTIQPGDTVKWTWRSVGFSHSVTSGSNGTSDGLFDSGIHGEPFTFSFTFPNAGTFPYFCIPHRSMGMVGYVTVADSTPTPTPTPTPFPGTVLGNISTRLEVETGDNALIGGFIVTGTQPKKVIVRAIGPSLNVNGVPVPGKLENPTLELDGPGGLIASNDDWRSTQEAEIIASTVQPTNDLESAIVATLPANSTGYTAIVRGVGNSTGIALVEAFDLDRAVDSKLANISTRGFVQTVDNVMIGGFIVLGPDPQTVIVRAIGPSLANAVPPVAGALADPMLELRDSNGALLASNDNWQDSADKQAIIDSGVPPTNDMESAIVATLPASVTGIGYTAIVSGVSGATGVGLVEVYALAP